MRYPLEKYYHWDDPLGPEGLGNLTGQDTRERLIYKKIERNWINE